MRKIGLTTTIPVEIVFAAGAVPVDLNNLFISSPNREKFVRQAELDGFPRNLCWWIKGIYGACLFEKIEEVIVVMQGDCSNSHALAETLQYQGVTVYPFSFPYDGDRKALAHEMRRLANVLGVGNWDEVIHWKTKLDRVRELASEVDRLTWQENKVSGFENHIFLVSTSDFEGNPDLYAEKTRDFIAIAKKRKPFKQEIRLGYIGVPPLFADIYDLIEEYGARVVFNETQRQFSIPSRRKNIVQSYLDYTYPYTIFKRIKDIKEQARIRNIHGIVHYAEAFCFRQIEDIILRKEINLPYILVEGGENFAIDARTKMRLQAFVDMLRH